MSWTDRTTGERARTILIDEETKDWRIDDDGNLAFDTTSVSQVLHAVMTKRGSVPTSPDYGSLVHEAWTLDPDMPRRFAVMLEETLQFLVDNGTIKAGTLDITVERSGPWSASATIDWEDGGGPQRFEVPIQTGFLP